MANQNEQRGGSGNFAKDHERASEAGRKGGEHSHQQNQSGGDTRQQGDHKKQSGGPGNFADDRERASEAGKKGGQR